MTDLVEMSGIKECPRCEASGEIAIDVATGGFIAAGPVPDDATGFAVSTCDECAGMGYVEEADND